MKKFLLAIAAVAVIVVIVVLAQGTKPQQYEVRIGHLPILPSKLPVQIAIEKGFFKELGLNVKPVQIASSNLLVDALIRGDVDITPEASVVPYFLSDVIDPGKLKIFSVMDLTTNSPFDSIIVTADSPIKELKDLQGKKIGVFSGTTATNMLKLYFKQKGIDISSMQFVQLAPGDQLTALYAGSIDALHAYEPTTAVALSDGKARRVFGSVYAALLNHSPLGAGLISAKFIQDHPAEAAKVTAAINKASDYMRSNDADTRAITAAVFQFDPAAAKAVALPYFRHSDQLDKTVVNALVQQFVTTGEIKSAPNLANAYYMPQ